MNNELILLTQASSIYKKFDLINKKTGGYFNIFDIAEIAHNEIVICRVLFELLCPTGSHHQGDAYLRLFIENVLRTDISDVELKTAKVHREYQIDSNRRIDLVIETAAMFVPIEVKVYAGEQENQSYDYYLEAKKHRNTPTLYYLTRFGEPPSEYSANNLAKSDEVYGNIVNISFASEILNWLELCLRETATIKIAPIREIILQFMSIIRRFTGEMEDEKEMELVDLIISSSDNMKSAMEIEGALMKAKTEMLVKIFKSIERKVGRQKLQDKRDYTEKTSVFYSYQRTNCPGISYVYKTDVCPDKHEKADIEVRIEIGRDIYVGYFFPENAENKGGLITSDELKHLLNFETLQDGHWFEGYWWPYYEMCLLNDESPNFKEYNNAYYDLYNQNDFDRFTTYCADRVLALLNR